MGTSGEGGQEEQGCRLGHTGQQVCYILNFWLEGTKEAKLQFIFRKVEHPGFTSTGSAPTGNDVALLRLQQGLDLTNSPNINSICWPTRAPPVGLQVTASGWGLEWQHLGLFGTSKVLKKVTIKL